MTNWCASDDILDTTFSFITSDLENSLGYVFDTRHSKMTSKMP